jgi:hypothetical protein
LEQQKTFYQNRFLSVGFQSHHCNKPVNTVSRHSFARINGETRPGRGDMRAAAEYRKRAEECRRLAQQMVAPQDKRALEELADRWEMLEKLRDRDLVPEN